jgi:trimeric autotransporter adhesin
MTSIKSSDRAVAGLGTPAGEGDDPAGQLTAHWQQAISAFSISRPIDTPHGLPEFAAGPRPVIRLADGDGGPSDRPAGLTPPPGRPRPADDPATDDPNFVPPTPYHSQYDGLTESMSGQPQQATSLEAPLDAASLLANNWNRWDLGSIDWAHPPDSLPPEARDALALVEGNPALLNAIRAGGDNGSVDGPVTRDSLDKFVGQAGAALAQASKDFQAWQRANPDADATATELARSAAILEANAPLLSNASGSSPAGWSGNVFNTNDLAALASGNPGLSPALAGAAKLWSDPGMFRQVDQAGQSPFSDPDGLVNGGNFGAWLTSNAPGDANSAMDFFNAVAARDATINVDTSNLTSDVFDHPENYTAAQRAAVLQQLEDAQQRLAIDNQLGVTDIGTEQGDGINPNLAKTMGDLQNRIDQLSADPDVQAYLSNTSTTALQTLVNADPALHDAFTDALVRFESGQTLNDDLNARDSDGNQVSHGDAVQTFVNQAGFFEVAMGRNGSPMLTLNLTEIAKRSGSYQSLFDSYNSDVVSANDVSRLIGSGDSTDVAGGLQAYAREMQAYNQVIDPATVAANAPALQANFSQATSDAVISQLTPSDIEAALGDGHGNLDESKLRNLIAAEKNANPGTLTGNIDDPTSQAGQAFAFIRNAWNTIRYGVSAFRSLGIIDTGVAPTDPLSRGLPNGVLHGISAIFGGISLGLTLGTGVPSDPAGIASLVGAGISEFGLLVNTGGRAYNAFGPPATPPPPDPGIPMMTVPPASAPPSPVPSSPASSNPSLPPPAGGSNQPSDDPPPRPRSAPPRLGGPGQPSSDPQEGPPRSPSADPFPRPRRRPSFGRGRRPSYGRGDPNQKSAGGPGSPVPTPGYPAAAAQNDPEFRRGHQRRG